MNNETPAVRQERDHRRLKTTLLICTALVVGAVLVLYLIFSTEPTARRDGAVRQTASLVDVVQGEYGTFRPTIEAMGTVRPAREISLSARVEGEVVALGENFEPGGFVGAGELLVAIDDADYRTVVEQRDSALEQAIAELEIERGEQQAARADYESFDRDLPPERRALVLREPQLRSAEANVASARADLRQAELDLERTTVEAPFAAHVLGREVNVGSQVTPGTALGRLVGLETYWVEATVPVTRLQWLSIPDGETSGSRVEVRNRNAWPEGASRRGELFRMIGELEGNTRLARILVAVDDPLAREAGPERPRLMLGEYVQCLIEGREIADVVRIDRDYIRADETIWLMADGRLVIQPVSIVFQDQNYAYIDEGLSEDDHVVTTRLATVREGLRLRLDEDADMAGGDVDA